MSKFVAYVHNNSLCHLEPIESIDDAINFMKQEATEKVGNLSDDQIESAEEFYEISDFSDSDNHHTWSFYEIRETQS